MFEQKVVVLGDLKMASTMLCPNEQVLSFHHFVVVAMDRILVQGCYLHRYSRPICLFDRA